MPGLCTILHAAVCATRNELNNTRDCTWQRPLFYEQAATRRGGRESDAAPTKHLLMMPLWHGKTTTVGRRSSTEFAGPFTVAFPREVGNLSCRTK